MYSPGYRRSRSIDPSCLQRQRELADHQQNIMSDFSAFGLQDNSQTPSDRGMPLHRQFQNLRYTSPMSPLSDRSIEPMSCSDVSYGDNMDISASPSREDTESITSRSSVSLWSTTQPRIEMTAPNNIKVHDFDTQSVLSEASCALSEATCASSQSVNSDGTVCTQRKPASLSTTSVTSSIPAALCEPEYDPAKVSAMKHSKILANGKERGACCKCLMRAVNLTVVIVLVACLVTFGGRDMQAKLCSQKLQYNISQLQLDLDRQVFGQHIAVDTVLEAISDLTSPDCLKNVTVLSFSGWTGIGKNYVSYFVGKQLSEDSVHKIIIPLDFAHGSQEDADNMYKRIIGSLPDCGFVLYVIDEVDKASPDAISGIHNALKHLHSTDLPNVKVLVLLLSNSGGSAITRYLLDQFIAGRDRESVTREEVLAYILRVDEAQIDHEWYIPLLEASLVDAVVPFLPLEKTHVRLCIRRYIAETRPMLRGTDIEEVAQHVLEQMTFFPQGQEVFSATGCRGVALKVDLTID